MESIPKSRKSMVSRLKGLCGRDTWFKGGLLFFSREFLVEFISAVPQF